MLSPFEVYTEYLAIKRHFTTSSYDYFKYNGKVSASVNSFEKRKDKLFFQKLAKHPDVHNFLIANLAINEKLWIRDLAYSEDADKNYKEWVRKKQSLSYEFKQDLSKLGDDFDEIFICKDNEHPLLLKRFLGGDISLETLCLLLNISGAKKHWNKKLQYDLVWSKIKTKIEKYTPFIEADIEKLKDICLDMFVVSK